METIRKTILMLSASCISMMAFSQAGLGVTSSTRAAVRSGITTNAAKSTLNATSNAAGRTLKATTSNAVNVTGKTVTAAEAKTRGALKRAEKAKIRKNANVDAGINSKGSFETGANNSSDNADAGIQVAIEARAKGDVDGEQPIKNINQVADEKKAMAEEKKAAAREKASDAKTKSKKELKKAKKETKNTVPRASEKANAEAKVHASSKSAVHY